MVAVMRHSASTRFRVVGHDRGGRVAHRMALDHPDAVERLAVLDIAPTATMFARTDQAFATRYYHWFFLIQPATLPERLIGDDPEYFLRKHIERPDANAPASASEARVQEYVRCFRDPATIHAICEDYRAAATIDLEHDGDRRDARVTARCSCCGVPRERSGHSTTCWRRGAKRLPTCVAARSIADTRCRKKRRKRCFSGYGRFCSCHVPAKSAP